MIFGVLTGTAVRGSLSGNFTDANCFNDWPPFATLDGARFVVMFCLKAELYILGLKREVDWLSSAGAWLVKTSFFLIYYFYRTSVVSFTGSSVIWNPFSALLYSEILEFLNYSFESPDIKVLTEDLMLKFSMVISESDAVRF